VLLRNPAKLLTQRQLLTEVWGPGYADASGNLRLYMAQLRRKLEPDPARPPTGCSPNREWATATSPAPAAGGREDGGRLCGTGNGSAGRGPIPD